MVAVLIAGSVVLAQGTPKLEPLETPKNAPVDPKLNGLLKEWENKMRKVDRFMVDCKRVETDELKGKSRNYKGQARYLKPNFALLDLTNVEKEEASDRELMVSNGDKLYEFKIRDKLVMVHDMPKNGGANDSTFLNFLLGLDASEVQKRYDLTLKKANEGEGYIYIGILPKLPGDKQEFKEAELVLYSQWIADIQPKNPARADWAFLPARLWFRAPNGNQSTWTFENYDLKANLKAESFIPPQWPKDWRTEVVKTGAQPLVEDPRLKGAKDDPRLKSIQQGPPKSKLGGEK
jgi:TIGR03009 family protein